MMHHEVVLSISFPKKEPILAPTALLTWVADTANITKAGQVSLLTTAVPSLIFLAIIPLMIIKPAGTLTLTGILFITMF